MHSNSDSPGQKTRNKKHLVILCTLNFSCILTLGLAIFQHAQIYWHCGKDFRTTAFYDSILEEIVMTGFEILCAIAGLVGIWTKKGAVYFVLLSFLTCTVMIQHFVDLVLGILYMQDAREEYVEVERFLKENYERYGLSMPFAMFKSQLLLHCGRDFRPSSVGDPNLEEIGMTCLEMVLSIAGLFGIYSKRGAVYFVAVSFLLCTVMVQHLVDLLTGAIYVYSYRGEPEEVYRFLKDNYHTSNAYTVFKMNRIHACMKCCGINGTDEVWLQLEESLIPSCCPSTEAPPCTKEKAYKLGCANELMEDRDSVGVYHGISVVVVILEFYTYRTFLNTFV